MPGQSCGGVAVGVRARFTIVEHEHPALCWRRLHSKGRKSSRTTLDRPALSENACMDEQETACKRAFLCAWVGRARERTEAVQCRRQVLR